MHSDKCQPKHRVTARDIARDLGLSQSTVSRVLSGAPDYRFSDETRRRILDGAERLGYRPHAVARSLRERRTRVIGFCSRHGNLDARNLFLAEIIGSLQRSCSERGEFLLLQNFDPNTSDDDAYGEIVSGRIDGLILHAGDTDPLVQRLAQTTLPIVAIADRIAVVPSVVCDDRAGIALAIQHLTDRGHRRIWFAHAPLTLASVRDRAEAYRTAMTVLGLAPVPVEVHYEAVEPILDMVRTAENPPTAVCCWNDATALILTDACHRAGLCVPDSLAVVGFDGLLDQRLVWQRLTTVSAHWPEVTNAALEVLRARMRGEAVPRETVIPVSLRIGETT
ncbi:MAG: LacI family transcriptional regulator [Armatimonadetes bacterium]|nr:LacI family transcriptional regulator [Armatimonadota bacterium]